MVAKFLFIAFLASQCMSNPLQKSSKIKNFLDETEYELNMPIEISTYKIDLTLKKNFHQGFNRDFEGIVSISFKALEEITEIKIHCAEFIGKELEGRPGKIILKVDGEDKEINAPIYDPITEILKIPMKDSSIPASDKEIVFLIDFVGTLYTDLKGFYLSFYENNINPLYLASTQFAPTYARRAFPCFDEPKYKAKFRITIHHPDGYFAISNGKANRETPSDGMVTTSFDESPKMSTYLVAFALHTMEYTNVIPDKMDIYYPTIYKGTEEFAKSISEDILNELSTFTNLKWDEVDGVTKIDQIVTPEIGVGSNDNWGLISYKDAVLLWDENNSGSYNKQRITSVISHQFAHMWFGNLVTLEKWDYTWLNEGLSTFFAHYIPDQLTKNELIGENYETMKQLALIQQSLFISDADPNVASLNHPVKSPDEILNKFNEISYNKGAAILLMISKLFTEEDFKKGIQKYINENKEKNVDPSKFFKSFEYIRDIEEVMEPWCIQAGYPVVKVTYNNVTKSMEYEQSRFVYPELGEDEDQEQIKKVKESKNPKAEIWKVPVSFQVIYDDEEQEEAKSEPIQTFWLEGAFEDMGQPARWVDTTAILVNINQEGYYRVNYDEGLWNRIKNVLDTAPEKIFEVNRAQIVDDVLNMARAEMLDYGFAFQQIEFLENESSYYPWYSAFQSFSFIYNRLTGNLRDLMKEYVQDISHNIYKEVNENEPNNHIERLRKGLIWKMSCEFDNPSCLQAADDLFNQMDQNPVPKDLQPAVYCAVVRHGDDANWNLLYNKLQGLYVHPSEKEIIRTALGCTLNEKNLKFYLDVSIAAIFEFKDHDAHKIFEAVVIGNPIGVDIALDFLIENSEKILYKYKSLNAMTMIINTLADKIITQTQLTKFRNFVNDKENNYLGGAQSIAEASIQRIETNLVWDESNADELTYFLDRYSTKPDSATQNEISLIILLTIFIFGKLF